MVACGGGSDSKGIALSQGEQKTISKGNRTTAIKVISAGDGGSIVFQDGVKLLIPANALSSDTEVSITKDAANTSFILRPEGLQTNNLLTLQIPVTDELLSNPEKIVNVYTLNATKPTQGLGTEQIKVNNLLTAFVDDLEEGKTLDIKLNRFSRLKRVVQDPLALSYFMPGKYVDSINALTFMSALNMYEVTGGLNKITEETGESIQFRVNPIFLVEDTAGTLSGTNLQYGYGVYSDYGDIGITPPGDFFSFTVSNLPDGASFDANTGVFTWNNIAGSYAGTSHNIVFKLSSSYPTATGSMEAGSISKTLIIDIEGSGVPLDSAISGMVKDAVNKSPLQGVQVKLSSNGAFSQEVVTDSDGKYLFESLEAKSGYSISFLISGYLTENYNGIETEANATKYLETVLQIDTQHSGVGNISGTISSALDGNGVSGLTINFRKGVNVTSGNIVKSSTTEADGLYTASDLEAGSYTGEIFGSGYQTNYFTVVVLGGGTNDEQNGTINPILVEGEIRIVLTWGTSPSDLDSHLTGPISNSSERFHVYFGELGSINGSPYSNLDVDDTSGEGPETVTIRKQLSGVYRYYVHDFSNGGSTSSRALADSSAKVKVYKGSGLVAEYNVPNKEGTLWSVIEISGNQIKPINTVSYDLSFTGGLRRGTNNEIDASLFDNLKPKLIDSP
jgi:hypothetical protein